MKVYVSGPMRGIEHCNFPLFDRARDMLLGFGWEVKSPADNDREFGFTGDETPNCVDTPGFPFREAITNDLDWIGREADAMVLLPGWQNSSGANLELTFARFLGLKIGYYTEHEYYDQIAWEDDHDVYRSSQRQVEALSGTNG